MVKTRTNKCSSQPYKHTRPSNTEDILDELLVDLSETNKDPQILVPLSEKLLKYENNLSGNSFIIVGPASSGKESHVLWLAKDINDNSEGVETHIITIDCRIYDTDNQFLNALTRQLRTFFGESVLSKHIVINQAASINLTGLNKQFEKLRKKQLLLIIKSAQILAAHQRKQKILYNICEWLNNTDAKKYITIVLLTKNILFLDKLEKRTKSRMNMPIVYIPKIKPKEVIQVIKKRIEYRIEKCTKKYAQILQKLMNAFENNKELMKVLEEQYQFCPKDVATYLKIMKLIITLSIKTVNWLQSATQGQINSMIAEGFSQYFQYSTDYKIIAKNLYINLPRPDILLLGFIRQRLINQQNRKSTQITLKILMQDYNNIRQKKNIMQGGVFCNYQQKVLQDALLRLQQQNFVTVAKQQNMELLERGIVSQYSPDDFMYFYKEYCKHDEQVPSFIREIYTSEIYHE